LGDRDEAQPNRASDIPPTRSDNKQMCRGFIQRVRSLIAITIAFQVEDPFTAESARTRLEHML
jgi:hypothetical protein